LASEQQILFDIMKCSCGCGQKATGTFYHQGFDRCHIPGRIECRKAFFGKRACPKCSRFLNDWNFSDSTNEWEEDEDDGTDSDSDSDSDSSDAPAPASGGGGGKIAAFSTRKADDNDIEYMAPKFLVSFAKDFQMALNKKLTQSRVAKVEFDAASLKSGPACGMDIMTEVSKSDFGTAVGVCLREFEASVTIDRVLFRRAPTNSFQVDGTTLVILRKFGSMPAGSCLKGAEHELLQTVLKPALQAVGGDDELDALLKGLPAASSTAQSDLDDLLSSL